MTEQHECEFKPLLVECDCGRCLTIAEICRRANATERLSVKQAKYAQGFVSVFSPVHHALKAYANVLEGK